MTSQHDKPKRWRPRFSVRTLVIVESLAAAYFGCWETTKRYGVEQFENHGWANQDEAIFDQATAIVDVRSPFPLVIQFETFSSGSLYRIYYFWFFGYAAKLPFDREI